MDYIIVNDTDGAIMGSVSTNVSYIPSVEGVAAGTHYWDQGSVAFQPRLEMPVVVDGLRIGNIPATGELSVTGPLSYEGPMNGPEVSFRFDLPGTYTVELRPDAVEWLPTTVELTVEEGEDEGEVEDGGEGDE